MNNLEDSIARMKALYTYGKVNENTKQSNSTLEYSAKAADGKYYGIVKECNYFYIKQASEGKEKLAEGYNYIGGYMNKNNYRYDSYNNALKNFELKLSSINEAHDSKVNVSTLDPFKKELVITEATDKMKNEIARQRQIMYNASMIMNESANYAVKGGGACNTSQPEAETGEKGDKLDGSKDAKAEPEYKGSKVGLDKKAEPFKENPSKAKDLKESCEGGSCDTDFDKGMDKGKDPKNVGWDIDDQEKVNESDEKEWDEGLPKSAGNGDANSKENNKPFDKTVNEDVDNELNDIEDVDSFDNELDDDLSDIEDIDDIEDTDSVEDIDNIEDTDSVEDIDDIEDTDSVEDVDNIEDTDSFDEEPIEGEEEIEATEVDETNPDSIRSEIERLQSLLDNMKDESEDSVEDIEDDEDEDEDDYEEEDFDDEVDLNSEEESFEDEDEDETNDAVVDNEESFEDEDEFKFESKSNFMKNIVESVVKQLKEEELHDFGKHPGYRKQPMNLPPTGQDKNEHGEDINDDSVHNEQPFGEKVGSSFPFDKLVNAVTKDVMYQLKHGVKLENDKKKVE